MRIAIVADVHSNLAAFEAVLRHAEAAGRIDTLWCLGDTVGYGPHPNECVGLLRRYEQRCVGGNHDLAACGRMGTEEFNEAAAQAALWTAEQLTEAARSYLHELPSVVCEGNFTLVHGSLRWPEWEYLLSSEQAQAHFELQRTPYGLVGQRGDGDPRAAYALYDGDARVVTYHRVEYDVAATQRAMEVAGLPRWL